MEKMTLVSNNFAKDTRGASFVEMIIITAVVALACIGAFTYFGDKVDEKVRQQGDAVSGINP